MDMLMQNMSLMPCAGVQIYLQSWGGEMYHAASDGPKISLYPKFATKMVKVE
jgi:hypothetical protein